MYLLLKTGTFRTKRNDTLLLVQEFKFLQHFPGDVEILLIP
jgi:hypothetical protein